MKRVIQGFQDPHSSYQFDPTGSSTEILTLPTLQINQVHIS